MTQTDRHTDTHKVSERERERQGENESGRNNNAIKKLSHTEVRKL